MNDRRAYAALLEHLPRERCQVLPALHVTHAVAGWLPEQAIEAVAEHTSVPVSELYGIISSYSELRLKPPHEPHVELCMGLSCRMAGADELLRAEASADATVESVACRFLCGVAPVAEVAGRYHGRLSPDRFRALIGDSIGAHA